MTDSVIVASDMSSRTKIYSLENGSELAAYQFTTWNKGLAVFDGIGISSHREQLKVRKVLLFCLYFYLSVCMRVVFLSSACCNLLWGFPVQSSFCSRSLSLCLGRSLFLRQIVRSCVSSV